jgi:hypothetical protein
MQRYVQTMLMTQVHLAMLFTMGQLVYESPLFALKVILKSGIKENVCMVNVLIVVLVI